MGRKEEEWSDLTGLSIDETAADLQGDFHTGTTISERATGQSCGGKCHVDVRGQRSGWDHTKATGTQVTAGYNQDLQSSTS